MAHIMNDLAPFVSVIIPHFNDPERLGHCLAQLETQTYPSDRYEIIVIDNGSISPPEEIINTSSHSHLLIEPKPSSYIARNCGLTAAQGEIIAFTDSDCLPKEDWLEKGVNALTKESNIGVVGGQIDLFPANKDAPTIAELYELERAFPVQEYVERWHFAPTANIFTFQEIVETVGMFDETLKSGGDAEWCQRVYAHGYKVVYAQDVCIRHPARAKIKDIYRRAKRRSGGLHDRQAKDQSPKLYFIQSFPHDILPPFKKSRDLWFLHKFPRYIRLQLIGIEWLNNYSYAYERVRLAFGGKSERS
jgi:glycosyltransferase involved in cell wall biosynthesis